MKPHQLDAGVPLFTAAQVRAIEGRYANRVLREPIR